MSNICLCIGFKISLCPSQRTHYSFIKEGGGESVQSCSRIKAGLVTVKTSSTTAPQPLEVA